MYNLESASNIRVADDLYSVCLKYLPLVALPLRMRFLTAPPYTAMLVSSMCLGHDGVMSGSKVMPYPGCWRFKSPSAPDQFPSQDGQPQTTELRASAASWWVVLAVPSFLSLAIYFVMK